MAGEDETKNGEDKRPDSASPPPSSGLSAVAGSRPDEGQDGADHRKEREGKRHWFPRDIKAAEWIMIAFTAVTAAATWGGVYVAHRQLQAMRDQLDEMRGSSAQTDRVIALQVDANANAGYATALTDRLSRAAQTQARGVTRSADVLAKQVAMQQRNFAIEERPRLDLALLPFPGVFIPQMVNGRLMWNFEVSNYGRSTATHLRIEKYFRLGTGKFIPDGGGQETADLAPGGKFTATVHYNGDVPPDPQTLGNPIMTMKVFIHYSDDLGNKYTTPICTAIPKDKSLPFNCHIMADGSVE